MTMGCRPQLMMSEINPQLSGNLELELGFAPRTSRTVPSIDIACKSLGLFLNYHRTVSPGLSVLPPRN